MQILTLHSHLFLRDHNNDEFLRAVRAQDNGALGQYFNSRLSFPRLRWLLAPFSCAIDLVYVLHRSPRSNPVEETLRNQLQSWSQMLVVVACISMYKHAIQMKANQTKPDRKLAQVATSIRDLRCTHVARNIITTWEQLPAASNIDE